MFTSRCLARGVRGLVLLFIVATRLPYALARTEDQAEASARIEAEFASIPTAAAEAWLDKRFLPDALAAVYVMPEDNKHYVRLHHVANALRPLRHPVQLRIYRLKPIALEEGNVQPPETMRLGNTIYVHVDFLSNKEISDGLLAAALAHESQHFPLEPLWRAIMLKRYPGATNASLRQALLLGLEERADRLAAAFMCERGLDPALLLQLLDNAKRNVNQEPSSPSRHLAQSQLDSRIRELRSVIAVLASPACLQTVSQRK